uniref:Dynactin subunit 6 n=1 Tax=Ciona intestinalis TaxID=7719 RepID=F6WCM2_CIOIN|nr:dynactin subunit 6-like [Ciona intestinalis]|eukprot:XP_002129731.1 dynactin subunit 6-like [Ciona intestinalis]
MLSQRKQKTNPNAIVAADALVCEEATLEGSITIGANCVVHPKAGIYAKDGPIVIGQGNIIEEQTRIINRNPPGVTGSSPLIIGNCNTFEVGSEFEGKSLGNNNVLEAKARVGPNTTLSNSCVIGAGCHVNTEEILPENTIICGDNYLRRINNDKLPSQTPQLDFLKKILPNYHFLVKPNKPA